MANIDIYNVPYTTVSSDLTGKSFLIYGDCKSGKTTVACQFPKPLLLAFEKGYGMLAGVQKISINRWGDALKVQKQLVQDARKVEEGKADHTQFKTIIIDTLDILNIQLEQYICDNFQADSLNGIPWGNGHKALSVEFINMANELMQVGYTVIFISHAEQKTMTAPNGETYIRIQPSIPARLSATVERMVDIVAYAEPVVDADGSSHTELVVRGSRTIAAGSRYKYMSPRFPFTIEAIQEEIEKAVAKELEAKGMKSPEKAENVHAVNEDSASYEDLINRIKELNKVFRKNDKNDAYTAIIEKRLGTGKLVKDCSERQTDVLSVIVDDLEDKLQELDLVVMN